MTKDFGKPLPMPVSAKKPGQGRVQNLMDKQVPKKSQSALGPVVLPILLVSLLCGSVVLPFTIAGQQGMNWARNATVQQGIEQSRQALFKSAGAAVDDVLAPFKAGPQAFHLSFQPSAGIPMTPYVGRAAVVRSSPVIAYSGFSALFAAKASPLFQRQAAVATPTPGVSPEVADAVAAIGRHNGPTRGFVQTAGLSATPIARVNDYKSLLASAMPKLKNLAAPAYVPDAAALGVRPTLDADGQSGKRVEVDGVPSGAESAQPRAEAGPREARNPA